MNDYNEVVTAWNLLYPKLHWRYLLQEMPFFRVIMAYFYEDNYKSYITPEEMKNLIKHYKNALNLYKENLRNGRNRGYLVRKIHSEYDTLLEIYDDLVNIQDMKNGKITTRTTTKTDR